MGRGQLHRLRSNGTLRRDGSAREGRGEETLAELGLTEGSGQPQAAEKKLHVRAVYEHAKRRLCSAGALGDRKRDL